MSDYENKMRHFRNQDKIRAQEVLKLAKSTNNLEIKLKAMKLYHRCEQASREQTTK